MSSNLLDEMRGDLSSKATLKQDILLNASCKDYIFVFEGQDDFPVYDEWLKRSEKYKKSGHLTAKGKKQIIDLYTNSKKISDRTILDKCFFFVDHDYDMVSHNDDVITTLSCYSIENYIVDTEAVKNYLTGEFKLDLKYEKEKNEIMNDFISDFESFNMLARKICKPLFVNYNMNVNVKFPDRISNYIGIEYKNIHEKKPSDIVEGPFDDELKADELRKEFEQLSHQRAVRGKYAFEFVKLWLLSVRDHVERIVDCKIKKDPLMLDYRRMASSSYIPDELNSFY